MNHAKRSIAMANLVWRNHPRGHEIVNLVQTNLLPAKFLPDGIEPFDSTFNADKWDVGLAHLLFDSRRDAAEKCFIFRAPFLQLLSQLTIVIRIKMTKRQILELAAQLTHAEPVRDRSKDLHGLFGNTLSLLGAEVAQRTHAVT